MLFVKQIVDRCQSGGCYLLSIHNQEAISIHKSGSKIEALQCLQSIHLGLGGKLTFHCCASSHIFRTEKAFHHIKLTRLRMHFASGSLLFKYKSRRGESLLFILKQAQSM